MNTLKLKVVLLCLIFFIVGYTVANFNTLKEKFCEVEQTQPQTNIQEDSDTASVYQVKNGDTLDTISKLFNVTKGSLTNENKLKTEKLTPGDTLIIPIAK